MIASEKKLLRKLRQAINDFQMIKPKEKVIVGISGGKDSMVMAWLLNRYRRIIKDKFEIRAFYVS
jgi:tRNA(Ile)-lysidine synthase TilS/MesJ